MVHLSVNYIKDRLQLPLPGESAHIPLSPVDRGSSSEALAKAPNFKESAVALILYENRKQLNGILMQRQVYKGFHSGQVCFPGGKKEDFDANLEETAIRESIEEIGLQKENFNLLGALTPVYIPVSNFRIQPFVIHYNEIPHFIPNTREVKEVFSFPIEQLSKNNIIQKSRIQFSNGQTLNNVPHFTLNGKIVWGATALILNEFRSVIRQL